MTTLQHLPCTPIDPTGRHPQADLAHLRTLGDLVPVELPGGIRAWAPTRHQTLKTLLTDPRVSKSPHHWDAWHSGWLTEHPEAQWITAWVGVTSMLTAGGPDHQRLRRLVAPAFSTRRIHNLRPAIEHITTDLLNDLSTEPAGATVDLRARFAQPLPIQVISDLFGLEPGEREQVGAFATAIMDTATVQDTAITALHTARTALHQLVARKQETPGDDLTTALIAARDGQDQLSTDELIDTLVLALTAGHETTVHLITNAVVALLQHPDQLASVRDGHVPWSAVVDETLRWAGSITTLPLRFATHAIDLAGQSIAPGDAILATFGGTGWDPDQHGDDAATFDVHREQKPHLAFGHGVHYCLGAPLARMEAEIALPALFSCFPRLALADGAALEPLPSFITHGVRTLDATLTTPTSAHSIPAQRPPRHTEARAGHRPQRARATAAPAPAGPNPARP
ncbi:cytochrome P450 family protein [Streptomyces noursei]|uniref:cytochrome P450 family protein n=1 Tax=Streptomyces noursei TaxID=1971 RepID=UPI0023B84EE8|nr:cytochrome P450 [Streptomyces noursei]